MPETTSHQLVVFSLGSEEYALPIGAVHEIIRFSEPRTVASEVPWIRGVIGLRGKIIPIFDLAARMGLEPSRPGQIVIRRRDSPLVARTPTLVVRLTELHWELHTGRNEPSAMPGFRTITAGRAIGWGSYLPQTQYGPPPCGKRPVAGRMSYRAQQPPSVPFALSVKRFTL